MTWILGSSPRMTKKYNLDPGVKPQDDEVDVGPEKPQDDKEARKQQNGIGFMYYKHLAQTIKK